jgi:hypothetical protein
LVNVIGNKSHSGEAQCYTECYRDEKNKNLEINNRLLEDTEGYLYKRIGYEGKNQKRALLHRGIIIKAGHIKAMNML